MKFLRCWMPARAPLFAATVAAGLLAAGLGCDGGSDQEEGSGTDSSGLPPTARVQQRDELRAGMEAPRHPSDGGGRAWIELADGETGAVMAGTTGTWSFVYEAGPLGIQEGGALYFQVPPFWGWSNPQTRDRRSLGFTTVESLAEGVELDARSFAGQPLALIEIAGRALEEGERIRLVYGAGEGGAIADRHAERGSKFWFAVDGDGDGVRELIDDCPAIDILPGPPARMTAVVSSTAQPGGKLRLTLAVLDAAAAAWVEVEGEFELESIPPGLSSELPRRLPLALDDEATRTIELTAGEAGTYRVRAAIEVNGERFTATSNPIWIGHDRAPVYWGDLHGHSNFSDGTGLPVDFFRYARDVASLDIVALTDHDHFGMRFLDAHPDMWAAIRSEVDAFNDPGRFVTLLAYEWTSWIHGHRHVLYFGPEGEVLSSLDEDYETPAQLWDALRGQPAMTFAHHSAGGPIATDWSYLPDPELEPLTEVMSVHGSSEAADSPSRIYSAVKGNYVRDILDRGVKFGFVASSDSHDGHPGFAHLSPVYGYSDRPPRGATRGEEQVARMGNGGLAAILADDLTRESVLSAMRARRTWATSGPRILLDVQLHGFPAGSGVPATALRGEILLRTHVSGTAPIANMDVIRSGQLAQRIVCGGRLDVDQASKLEGLEVGEYVYLRVEQEDGGLAWSSPFFIE